MQLFPAQDLSDSEKNMLAEILSAPVVQKYLQVVAYNIGSAIVNAIPDPDTSTDTWLKQELYLKGQLSMLTQLHSIKPLPKE